MDPVTTGVSFADLARTSKEVAGTRSRLRKKALFVSLLTSLAKDEVPGAVGWLTARPTAGPIGVGPSHLWEFSKSPPAATPRLSLADVERDTARARAATPEERATLVRGLIEAMTDDERTLFVGALTDSLRQGSADGVMLTALAELTGTAEDDARHTAMITGSIVAAASAMVRGDVDTARSIELFRPIAPMLASTAESVDEKVDPSAAPWRIEWKVDGVRAQVHKAKDVVRIFSRQGKEITEGCARLLPALRALPAETLVLDAEVVLEGDDGRALPFQETFSALASKSGTGAKGARVRLYAFDVMHAHGVDRMGDTLEARATLLAEIVPEALRMPFVITNDAAAAEAFDDDARSRGHEGVMVKELASTYRAGTRSPSWWKVKAVHTVDLVVLAVEPGSGRRKGTLSNLHLGARRDDGTFCMVGKTFKGLTDAMLAFQTAKLRSLATSDDDSPYVVHVRPELVVEIRFNDVQRSPRYPGGIALRFARVVRYREDKRADEIEPLASLVALLPETLQDRQLSLFDAPGPKQTP